MVTNVDDIVLLTLLFSRLPDRGRALPLMGGQVLGFSGLVLISLLGVIGRHALPEGILPLLGLLPIALGIRSWCQSTDAEFNSPTGCNQSHGGLISSHPITELLGMAGLTMVNGSDNVGVYLPMFAHADGSAVTVILLTFAAGLSLWLALAWGLTRTPAIAPVLQRYGSAALPAVLISLGLLILFTPPNSTLLS